MLDLCRLLSSPQIGVHNGLKYVREPMSVALSRSLQDDFALLFDGILELQLFSHSQVSIVFMVCTVQHIKHKKCVCVLSGFLLSGIQFIC